MKQGRYVWIDGKPVYQGKTDDKLATKASTSLWEVIGTVIVVLFAAFCYWVA